MIEYTISWKCIIFTVCWLILTAISVYVCYNLVLSGKIWTAIGVAVLFSFPMEYLRGSIATIYRKDKEGF